ncbi:MAG TPA: amidase family protein, partial [Trueperaceae bacterium]|nr:amidase family protein [Trueperaceae bacterium]
EPLRGGPPAPAGRPLKDGHPVRDGRQLRVGAITELAGSGMSAGALDSLARARQVLTDLGVEVVDVSLPSVAYAVPAYYVIATAEASSNLARYDGMLYGGRVGADADGQAAVMTTTRGSLFGREVRRRILLGSFALSAGYYDAYYGRAMKVRSLLARELATALADCDALLSPTATSEAYTLGEKLSDPIAMYVGDVATCLANLGGLPAITIPCGSGAAGLPLGIQLMAAQRADDALLDMAQSFASA